MHRELGMICYLLLVVVLFSLGSCRGEPSATGYPYFGHWRQFYTSGVTLVHDDFVLTSADVFRSGLDPLQDRVYLGSHKYQQGIPRKVTKRIPHPLANLVPAGTVDRRYDFMLVKLDRSALVDENDIPTGLSAIAINRNHSAPQKDDRLLYMGHKLYMEDQMYDLQATELRAEDTSCRDGLYGYLYDPETMLCAGHLEAKEGDEDDCFSCKLSTSHSKVQSTFPKTSLIYFILWGNINESNQLMAGGW
jgi:Trypsin